MVNIKKDYTGQKFGKWTVVREIPTKKCEARRAICRCDCGRKYERNLGNLVHGLSTQCKSCAMLGLHQKKDMRRKENVYRVNGETLTTSQVMEKFSLERNTVRGRVRNGVPMDTPLHGGRILTHNGESMNMSNWAKRLGVSREMVRLLVKQGYTIGEIVERYEYDAEKS